MQYGVELPARGRLTGHTYHVGPQFPVAIEGYAFSRTSPFAWAPGFFCISIPCGGAHFDGRTLEKDGSNAVSRFV
jgi:hypothetical protein